MAANQSRQEYIEKYKDYAMEQMRRYGIPASVTLAQACIESADGRSKVSTTANNHFGIKGTWNGQYVLADDDKPNEKFRKYDNVGQSYEDHSRLLANGSRYRGLFNLQKDDYVGWCNGLQQAGYATNPKYSSTLQTVIKENGLDKYDKIVIEQMKGREWGVAANPLSNGNNSSVGLMGVPLSNSIHFAFPVKREEMMLVTSAYGARQAPTQGASTQHMGIDINAKNDFVVATEDNGRVVAVHDREDNKSGRYVIVEYDRSDGSKVRTSYLHLSQVNVKVGDVVNAGTSVLGVTGKTGIDPTTGKSSCTGEHLHFGVSVVDANGKSTPVDPAKYLAELSVLGNIPIQVKDSKNKDLLSAHRSNVVLPSGQTGQDLQDTILEEDLSPDGLLKKLLSSEDSGAALPCDDPLVELIMTSFIGLFTLANAMDSEEQQLKEAATDAAVSKRIDLSTFSPNLKSSAIKITEEGKMAVEFDAGKGKQEYELSNEEVAKINDILSSSQSSETKGIQIANYVSSLAYRQQASQNYEQIESESQQQQRQQSVSR